MSFMRCVAGRAGVAAVALFGVWAGSAAGQDCTGAISTSSGTVGQISSAIPELRVDVSNPGARALALGGAFTSSADDATALLTNPAGLTAQNRPSVQVELRSEPTIFLDRYDQGLQPAGGQVEDNYVKTEPHFVSPVKFLGVSAPVGDKWAVGAFYQMTTYTGSGDGSVSDRGSSNTSAYPCFTSLDRLGNQVKLWLPLPRARYDTAIYRAGASVGWRPASRLAVGVAAYFTQEKRTQEVSLFNPDSYPSPTFTATYDADSSSFGAVFGAQYMLSEAVRLGATYALPVKFDRDQQWGTATVLPGRLSLGATGALGPKLALFVDGVWVQTSQRWKETDLQLLFPAGTTSNAYLRDPASWDQSDSYEARLGLEYTFKETRTTAVTGRLGGWLETGSNVRLKDNPGVTLANRVPWDYLRIVFPDAQEKTRYHVAGGLGLTAWRRWRFDLGVDYETTVTKAAIASLLVGASF